MGEATTYGIIATVIFFVVVGLLIICLVVYISRRNRIYPPGYYGMNGEYARFGGYGPYSQNGPYGGYGGGPLTSVAPGHVISTPIQNPPPPAVSPAAVVQPNPSKPAVNSPLTSPAKTDRTTAAD